MTRPLLLLALFYEEVSDFDVEGGLRHLSETVFNLQSVDLRGLAPAHLEYVRPYGLHELDIDRTACAHLSPASSPPVFNCASQDAALRLPLSSARFAAEVPLHYRRVATCRDIESTLLSSFDSTLRRPLRMTSAPNFTVSTRRRDLYGPR
jgi:hypothetical protein